MTHIKQFGVGPVLGCTPKSGIGRALLYESSIDIYLSMTDISVLSTKDAIYSGFISENAALSVVAVNGLFDNVSKAIAGNNGGLFTINSDCSFSFNHNNQFFSLEGGRSVNTSMKVTLSDGYYEKDFSINVIIASGDAFWDQTVLCINANKYAWKGSRKIFDDKGNVVNAIFGNTSIQKDANLLPNIAFNGTSDYLTIADTPNLSFPARNFTFEFFCTIDSTSYGFFYSHMNSLSSNANCVMIGYWSSTFNFYYEDGYGGYQQITWNYSATPDNIMHVAIVKNGLVLDCYVNGSKLTASGTLSASPAIVDISGSIYLGTGRTSYTQRYATGKLYSLRITDCICRYTSDFFVDLTKPYFETGNLWWTPKPKVLEQIYDPEYLNWDKTISCVNFYGVNNSTSFTDELSGNTLTANGDAKIAVASNLSYANFDGTGDSITHSLVPGWYFGATDWCIELFVEPTATGTVLSDAVSNGGYYAIMFIYDSTNGRFTCLLYDASVNLIVINTANSSVAAGTKYHVAVVRYGTRIYLFLNGALAGTGTIGDGVAIYQSGLNLKLGVYGTGDYFTGKVYAVKISHFARYLTAFTIDSTIPYFTQKPVISNWKDTVLSISAQGMKVGSTDIRDYKNSIISIIGDTKGAIDSNNLAHINFDGIGDGLLSSGMTSVMPSTGWCFSFVAKINGYSTVTTYSTIFTDNIYGAANFNFYINFSGVITPFLRQAPYTATIDSDTANVAHYCFDFDGTTLRSFKNGILKGSCAFSGDINIVPTFGIMYANSLGTNVKLYSMEIVKKSKHTSNFKVDLTNPYFPVQETCVDVWIDPSERKNMTLATGVSDIKERSGNDLHFIQSTAAYQPSLMQNYANGLPALDFDGTTKFMILPAAEFPKPKEWLVECLINLQNVSGSSSIMGQGNSAGDSVTSAVTISIYSGYPNKLLYQFGNGSVSSYGYCNATMVIDTDYLIGQIHKEGTSFVDYFLQGDKQTITQTLSGSTTCSGAAYMLTIGAVGEYTGSPIDGQIADIVIAKYLATDYFRMMIEGFITKKYAKTGILSAGHKFKNFFQTEDKLTDPYASNVVLCLNSNEQYRQDMYFDSSCKNSISKSGAVSVLCGSDNKPYFNFDGTANCCLFFPSNNALFGSRDFTIELFVEIVGFNANSSRILNANGDIYHEISIGIESTGMLAICMSSNGTSWNILFNPSVFQTSLNTLYHIAVVRSGSNLYAFVNGVKIDVTSSLGATILTSSNSNRSIGGQSSGANRSLNGKIYSYRITDGVARYTSDFTPDMSNPYFGCEPDKNDPYWNNVDLLISPPKVYGLNSFSDLSGKHVLTPTGSGVVTADTEPYDSIYFPGSVGINVDSPLTYLHDGVTKWTLDVAFSITSLPSVVHHLIGNFTNNTQGVYPYLHVYISTTGKIVCMYSGVSGTYLPFLVSSESVPLNSVVKVRITFDGSVFSVVIDGKLSGISVKGSFVAGTSSTTNMCIGKYPANSHSLVGNIHGLRITKGVVRKQEDYSLPFK